MSYLLICIILNSGIIFSVITKVRSNECLENIVYKPDSDGFITLKFNYNNTEYGLDNPKTRLWYEITLYRDLDCFAVYGFPCGFCGKSLYVRTNAVNYYVKADECLNAQRITGAAINRKENMDFFRKVQVKHKYSIYSTYRIGYYNGWAQCKTQTIPFTTIWLQKEIKIHRHVINLQADIELEKKVKKVFCWIETIAKNCLISFWFHFYNINNNTTLRNSDINPQMCFSEKHQTYPRDFSNISYAFNIPNNLRYNDEYSLLCQHLTVYGWSLIFSNYSNIQEKFESGVNIKTDRGTSVFSMVLAVLFVGVILILVVNGSAFYLYKKNHPNLSSEDASNRSRWANVNMHLFKPSNRFSCIPTST